MKSYGFLVWVALFLMLPVVGMSGELYQYQDHSGSLFYTDDSAGIPENKLPEVHVFNEIVSNTTEPSTPPGQSIPDRNSNGNKTDNQSLMKHSSNEADIVDITADQLDAENERLDQLYKELQTEQAELSDQSLKDLTRKQLNAYEQQVVDLNARISQYKQEQKEFQAKVEQYNAWIKSNEEKTFE